MENKNHFNIDLLNATNYHTWKFRMITLLTEKEIMKRIEEEFNEANYADDQRQMKQKAIKEDNLCKSLIVQCLEDSQIDLVRDKGSVFSMWKSLESRYEKKGMPEQIVLRKRIMAMKFKEQEDLEVFLTEFEDTIRQLKATGAEIEKKSVVCSLLLAMPKSFETVITILENMPPNELTLDVVKVRLRVEIERRKANGEMDC